MPAFVGWKGNEFASESLHSESSPVFSALLSLLERLKAETASRTQLHGSSYSPVQNDLKLNPLYAAGAVEARRKNCFCNPITCEVTQNAQRTKRLDIRRLPSLNIRGCWRPWGLDARQARATGVPKKQNKNPVKDRWLYNSRSRGHLLSSCVFQQAGNRNNIIKSDRDHHL